MPIYSFAHCCCSPFRFSNSLMRLALLLLFTIKIYTRQMPFSQPKFRLEIDWLWDLPMLWFTDTRNLTDVEMPRHRDFLILTIWRDDKKKKTNRFGGTNSNNNLMIAAGDFTYIEIGMRSIVSRSLFTPVTNKRDFSTASVVLRWKMNRFEPVF